MSLANLACLPCLVSAFLDVRVSDGSLRSYIILFDLSLVDLKWIFFWICSPHSIHRFLGLLLNCFDRSSE